jgi:PAS domain S-box-containing protein
MKSIHLTLKERFTIIVATLVILAFALFITCLNQLKKIKEFNKLYDEAYALSESHYAIDSIQNVIFASLPKNLNFYKTGKSNLADNLKSYIVGINDKTNRVAYSFFLVKNEKIKINAFNISRQFKTYNSTLDEYIRLLLLKGFNKYGINGQVELLTNDILDVCKKENLAALTQKVVAISEIKNEYLLSYEPALINKIRIENEEAKALAILSTRNLKLTLLSKLQKLEELIVNMSELDEAIGFTQNDGLLGKLNNIKEQFAIDANEIKSNVSDEMSTAIYLGYVWLTLVFVLLLLAVFGLYKNLEIFFHKPIGYVKFFLAELVKGKLPEKIVLDRHDEIEDMVVHLNKVVEGLKTKAEFAIEIGKGKLESTYQPLSDDDILGNALIEMEKSLQKADMEDQKYKNEEKKRIWSNEGIARFGEILRLHSNDVKKLADEIIQNLVSYLNALQGGLFFFNDEQKDDIYLELVAAFAYDRKKYVKQKIILGEGLIGTAALEKEKIFLTEIPENYLSITSGLGNAPPKSILIVPLKLEDEILGVVELASFHIIQPHEIEFVEKIAQTIASTITSVKINAKTAKLLEQSQKQAEEMAEQEEEMRQNMEELRTTQEDFNRRESEISGFLNAIQNSTMVLVYDEGSKIIDVNEHFVKVLRTEKEDLIGRYHREFTSLSRNQDELDRFWNELRLGHSKSVVEKIRLSDGKEIYLRQVFSPVFDNKGALSKVLCISTDITDIKTFEIKLEEKSNELIKVNKDLHLLNEAIDNSLVRCEFSVEGRIINVNDNYCKITGHARNELIGKISTIYMKEEEKIQFEKIWNEVIKDKTYTGSIKRSKPTGEEIWLMSTFVPVKDEEENVKTVFFLALDITERRLKYKLLEEANKEIERLRKLQGLESE